MVEGLQGSASSLCPRVVLRGGEAGTDAKRPAHLLPTPAHPGFPLGSPSCGGDIGPVPSDGKLELITRGQWVTGAWGKMKMYLIKYSQALKRRGFR